jgi:acyl-coenzyme A thioesterase PaaI-like protein
MTRSDPALLQALQKLLDDEPFTSPWRFRVESVGEGRCTLELPFRDSLARPGGIMNGPALMAAADCSLWLAIKSMVGIEGDALTSEMTTAFLAPAIGESVLCHSSVMQLGKRRIYGTAECRSASGKIFSHHTLTYARVR